MHVGVGMIAAVAILAAARPSDAVNYKEFDVYRRKGDITGYLNKTGANAPATNSRRQLSTPPTVWDPPIFAPQIFAQRRSPTTDVIAFSQ